MIFKQLAALCRAHKRIWLYGDPEKDAVQWISDGGALYPLHGMPAMDGKALPYIFDVPSKDLGKYSIRHQAEKPGQGTYSYSDQAAETMLQPEPILIKRFDTILCPVRTSRGLMFYDPEYLKPLRDVQDTLELYERATPAGQIYFAAKSGFLLQALIMPMRTDNIKLLSELQSITQSLLETVEGTESGEGE